MKTHHPGRALPSKRVRLAIAGMSVVVSTVGLTAAAAPATAYPGELCYARSGGAPFWNQIGTNSWMYTVPYKGGIREEGGRAYHNGTEYRYGHGNGQSSGWFRLHDSTCL